MTAPLKVIRLPAKCQGWEAKLGLAGFVNSKSWNMQPRRDLVEKVREAWLTLGLTDFADDPGAIVSALHAFLLSDEEMLDYVLNKRKLTITSDADWQSVTETYAYVILQRYNREMGRK